MSQSLSKLYVHVTFHIKRTSAPIRKQEFDQLFSCIAEVLKSLDCYPIQVGGVENHIHVLSTMSKNVSLAKMMEEIKRHSSRWLKTKDVYFKRIIIHCWFALKGQPILAQGTALGIEIGNWK